MSLLISTSLDRKFEYTVKGKKLVLADPDPNMPANEVMDFYSNQYPELVMAKLQGPDMGDDGTLLYTFATASGSSPIGTKG